MHSDDLTFKKWLEDAGPVYGQPNGVGAFSEIPSKYQTQSTPPKKQKKQKKSLHITTRKHKLK